LLGALVNNLSRLIVFVLFAALFVCLFHSSILEGGLFAFRDAAHFYYPLFKFERAEWAAGRVPLWNPYENLGQPLAADAASSVFYPGKLVFALPWDYAWAYRIYILGHVLLAAATAYLAARHFKASIAAAGICAISYAFCGNVLFDYCNVVFLVGAAWLPAAIIAADRMLRERSIRWAACFGVVLALMTLGGDPQMAYNAGLLGAMYSLFLDGGLSQFSRQRGHSLWKNFFSPRKWDCPLRTSRVSLLLFSAVVGFLLSAVQVLISWEFAGLSDRSPGRISDRLLGQLPADTHQEYAYHFSVAPWRLAEYVWPNCSGRQFPVNRRWLNAIPVEGRAWTPSLYMGVLPLLLALAAFRLRRGEPLEKWLSWTALLGVLGSFGWFAPGWLAQELFQSCGGSPDALPIGAPFGGVYWLMTVALPGYAYFRYPAKLLVLTAAALSLLAARGWDAISQTMNDTGPHPNPLPKGEGTELSSPHPNPLPRAEGTVKCLRRLLLWFGAASLIAVAIVVVVRPFWDGWFLNVEGDALLGPLDRQGAYNDLLLGLLHTAVVCGLFYVLFAKRSPIKPTKASAVSILSLILVSLDIALANRWMIASAPAELWESVPAAAMAIEQSVESQTPEPCRVYRDPALYPPEWKNTSSTRRLAESVQWDRDTLFPKYNLDRAVAMVDVSGTMAVGAYTDYLAQATNVPALMKATGAKYAIMPSGRVLPGAERVKLNLPGASLWSVSDNNAAIIDSDDLTFGSITYFDPHRIEIEVELAKPGMVVLKEQYYPGWRLMVDGAESPIERMSGVFPGVQIPAGKHDLCYYYQPTLFLIGAVISGFSWLVLTAGGLRWFFRKSRFMQPFRAYP
jgi:hypothetical protein